jgi:hypothetical protein
MVEGGRQGPAWAITEREKAMVTKKMTPKKTNKSKVLHKAKKLEATKPLALLTGKPLP